MRAPLCARLYALAFCAMSWPALALEVNRPADTVNVDTSAGYARLLFRFAAPSTVNAQIADGVLTIRTARPLAITAETLTERLASYVSSGRRDADGTYRFALARPVRLHQSTQQSLTALDLVPDTFKSDPPDLPPPPPPPHEVAIDVATLPVIPVRVGEHSTYTRLVFDWPSAIKYETISGQGRVTIRFDTPARPDFAALERRSPPWVKNAVWRLDRRTLVVDFDTDPQSSVQHFQSGNRIAIDVLAPKTDAATFVPLPLSAALASPLSQADVLMQNGPVVARPPASLVSASTAAPNPTTLPAPIAGGVVTLTSEQALQSPAGPPRAELTRDGATLHFPASRGRPVAVFTRGGTIWIVLDQHPALDPVSLLAGIEGLIEKAEATHVAGAAVLRVVLKNALVARVKETNESLEIAFAAQNDTPPEPIILTRQGANGISNLTSVLPGAYHAVALVDPVVGDRVFVVPARLGRGMLGTKRFLELETLPSSAGLVVIPRADDLTAHVENEIAVFARPMGLSLSDLNLNPTPQVVPQTTGESAAFLDFVNWSRSDAPDMYRAMRIFRGAAAKVPEASANKPRLRFAQYLLANELAAEALGELRMMAKSDPKLVNDPGHLTMLGAAEYMMGRYVDADRTLAATVLDGDVHAALWRGLAKTKLEQWANAKHHLQLAQPAVRKYAPIWQARVQLARAETGLALSDLASTTDALDLLPRELSARDVDEMKLLKARLTAAQGYNNQALADLIALEQSEFPAVAARATYARVEAQLAAKKIKPVQAAEVLETLRFRWRGDGIELKTLRKLGAIYIGEKKWREGLETLRIATLAFPGSEAARTAQDDMRKAFSDLFLAGNASALSPVQALSLFYDFSELTPIGRDGDEMIRLLSDRLVAIDLLAPAEELLLHQVNERLEGVARSVVATKLATIYLLDQKPRDVLQVLGDTRQAGLPEDLTGQRRYLEVRALADLKRFNEAIDLIAEDDTKEAHSLRADIYWQSGNWALAGARIEDVLGDRWQMEPELSEAEQAQVLRAAVAYALGSDRDALSRLRSRFGSKMAKGAEAKAFAVVTEDAMVDGLALRELAKRVASVDTLQAYMDDFRKRSAAPTKTATN